ncbi:MAG: hypothetical protein V1688_00295 [bacterium]
MNKKSPSWKFILLILFNIAAIAAFAVYVLNLQYNIFSKIDYNKTEYLKPSPHYYKNPNIGLEKVLARVFLFEPNDINAELQEDWRGGIETVFNKIQTVHKEQFFDLSNIEYIIYPEIIKGDFPSEYYDKEVLKFDSGKDEKQLNLIMDEINERIKNKELNKINLEKYNYNYLANQIFYFGSNKFGDDNVSIAGYTNEERNSNSSILFWRPLSRQDVHVKATIIYHEILHTLGVPEGYTYDDFTPFVDDIMGMGAISNRPIEINYLSNEFKKEMGL